MERSKNWPQHWTQKTNRNLPNGRQRTCPLDVACNSLWNVLVFFWIDQFKCLPAKRGYLWQQLYCTATRYFPIETNQGASRLSIHGTLTDVCIELRREKPRGLDFQTSLESDWSCNSRWGQSSVWMRLLIETIDDEATWSPACIFLQSILTSDATETERIRTEWWKFDKGNCSS